MDSSFSVVMARLRDGDPEAASQVFGKFLQRLIALASCHFETRLRSKFDPEDVIQSVYLSFVRRMDGSPYDLQDWGGLWSLLASITIHKCHKRRQFWRAAKRDIASEVPNYHDPDGSAWWEEIERGPTPLQAMILAETWEELISHHTPIQRTIAEMTFQGYTGVEIARRCDCSERTVYRAVKRIREQLTAMDVLDILN